MTVRWLLRSVLSELKIHYFNQLSSSPVPLRRALLGCVIVLQWNLAIILGRPGGRGWLSNVRFGKRVA